MDIQLSNFIDLKRYFLILVLVQTMGKCAADGGRLESPKATRFVFQMPLLKNNRLRFLASGIKIAYSRGHSRWKAILDAGFTVSGTPLRTKNTYQLVSRLRIMLSEWKGVLQFISQSGFSIDCVLFSFNVHYCFMPLLKTSADTNVGQSYRLTHCIKNLRCYNLKS